MWEGSRKQIIGGGPMVHPLTSKWNRSRQTRRQTDEADWPVWAGHIFNRDGKSVQNSTDKNFAPKK